MKCLCDNTFGEILPVWNQYLGKLHCKVHRPGSKVVLVNAGWLEKSLQTKLISLHYYGIRRTWRTGSSLYFSWLSIWTIWPILSCLTPSICFRVPSVGPGSRSRIKDLGQESWSLITWDLECFLRGVVVCLLVGFCLFVCLFVCLFAMITWNLHGATVVDQTSTSFTIVDQTSPEIWIAPSAVQLSFTKRTQFLWTVIEHSLQT